MQEIVLSLEKLQLTRFDTKTLRGLFTLSYTKNDQKDTFTKEFALEKSEPIVEDIIKTLKALAKIEVRPGDALMGSMFVIRLLREDKLEEKLYTFFVKVCEKARMLKRETDHVEYMKLYDDIRMQQLIL